MKVIVTLEEAYIRKFEVDAPSIDDALEIGTEKYKKGEFTVDNDTLSAVQIMAESKHPDSVTKIIDSTEWEQIAYGSKEHSKKVKYCF